MMLWFYLDDEREVPIGFEAILVRTPEQMKSLIDECWKTETSFGIDFDHDLGSTVSGYDIAKYIVSNNIPMSAFHIHSMNPVGADNIRQLLCHYGYIESW